MGSKPSKPRTYHNLGERGRFLTSKDLFVKRFVEQESEQQLHQLYDEYLAACARCRHSQLNFQPNEDFQLAFELIDENPFARLRAVQTVSDRYLHDVLAQACRLIDHSNNAGASAEDSAAVSQESLSSSRRGRRATSSQRHGQVTAAAAAGEQQRRRASSHQQRGSRGGKAASTQWSADERADQRQIGISHTERGFFYFLWSSVIGEKFGRTEVKGCRMMAELFSSNARVPLAYHVKYKGRAVTILALCPVTPDTLYKHEIAPETDDPVPSNEHGWRTEWDVISMEIAAALKMKSYDIRGRPYYVPPDAQRHDGLDGRRYLIANGYWLPRLPPPAPKRSTAQHFYTSLRPLALMRTSESITARNFCKTSMVHEDRAMVHAASQLVDVDVHALAKVKHTESILREFRSAGFNYSLLGVLLCSLLRNVTPPERVVDAVITELMARGVADYVADVVCPMGDRHRLARAAELGSGGGGGGDLTDPTGLGRHFSGTSFVGGHDGGADMVGESARFFVTAHTVLREVLDYEGDPAPKPETPSEPGVGLPTTHYGGAVLPHVYRKFRLMLDDVNLFQAWRPEMRRDIYGRAAQLLGLRVAHGVIKDAVPILAACSTPSSALALWTKMRLQSLATDLLLRPLAPRSAWERDGPGLVLLLRLNPAFYVYYEKMAAQLTHTELPFIDEHAIAVTPHLGTLEEYVDAEWDEQKALPNDEFSAQRAAQLIRLLRMVAAAQHDVGRVRDAIHNLRRGRRLCERIFEQGLSVLFCPQFRVLTQQLRDYSPPADLSPLTEMLRLTLKHCPLDMAIAFDYATVGIAQLALGLHEEAQQNLMRARHIAEMHSEPSDPRLHVMIANEAELLRLGGHAESAVALLRPVVDFSTCPPGVLRLAAEVFSAVGDADAALAVTIRAEHVEGALGVDQPPIAYAVAPTGGRPGTKVQVEPEPTMTRRGTNFLRSLRDRFLGLPGTERATTSTDEDSTERAGSLLPLVGEYGAVARPQGDAPDPPAVLLTSPSGRRSVARAPSADAEVDEDEAGDPFTFGPVPSMSMFGRAP